MAGLFDIGIQRRALERQQEQIAQALAPLTQGPQVPFATPLPGGGDAFIGQSAEFFPGENPIQGALTQLPGLLSEQQAQILAGLIGTPGTSQAGQAVLQQLFSPQGGLKSSDLVKVAGPDGQPVFVPASQAPGLPAFDPSQAPDVPNFGDIAGQRQRFIQNAKPFVDTLNAYNRVLAVTGPGPEGKPTAFGDLAAIFNFMKMVDPGSVVRESEFATAESAKGWLGRMDQEGREVPNFIRGYIQRLSEGTRLLPEQRQDLVRQARNMFRSIQQTHLSREQQGRAFAELMGIDPKKTVPDLFGGLRPPEGFPPGSVFVGKEKGTGKRVFEAPDGTRFVED